MSNVRKRLILMLALIAMALTLTACGGAKLDLQKYVAVEFTGVNERGVAQISVDYQGMAEAINKHNKGNGSLAEAVDAAQLKSSMTYTCDAEEGLKNGDTVNVTFSVSEELMTTYDFSVSNTELSFQVADLPTPEKVDAFADVQVHFEGCAPFASATVENNADNYFLQQVTYEMERDTDLKNGDVVTVTAVYNDELVEEYDCIPETDTKEYPVEGLEEYITSFDDLQKVSLNEMLTDSRDRVEALIAGKSELCGAFSDYSSSDPDFYDVSLSKLKQVTSYLLVSKGSKFETEDSNRYIVLYHTTGRIKVWLDPYEGDMFIAVSYPDLKYDANGALDADLTKAEYHYFQTQDEAYSELMTSNKDNYKVYEQQAEENA